jgi:arsenate reductase
MVRIYGIKNCDTMKKAFALLEKRKVAYQFHDYKKDGVPVDKLAAWAKREGWEKLANMRGPTWRKIQKPSTLDERSALRLLEQNSSAIRRPIVEAGDRLLIGFEPAEFEKL